jgi:hypothetical protein
MRASRLIDARWFGVEARSFTPFRMTGRCVLGYLVHCIQQRKKLGTLERAGLSESKFIGDD